MSNYSQITDFSVKDDLNTGDPDKKIKGVDVDGELAAIATAIATKYDSTTTNIPEASIADGSVFPRLAATETITGQWTFTGATYTFSNTQPVVRLWETDAGTDEKIWRIVTAGGDFFIQTMTDVYTSGETALGITRDGTNITAINLVAEAFTVNTYDILPVQGSFTVYLRASNNGADLASGTAVYRKMGNMVNLYIPPLTTTGSATTLVLDALPAAIQSAWGATQNIVVPGNDAGTDILLVAEVHSGTDYITLHKSDYSAFTGAGTHGIKQTTFQYLVA